MSSTFERFIPVEQIEEKANAVLRNADQTSIAINPVAVAHHNGIEVFQTDFPDESVSGLIRRKDGKYQIHINRTHSSTRARYTIAHELGHFFLHKDYASEFVDPELNLYRCDDRAGESPSAAMEVQANMFAASLLMPAWSVKRQFAANRDVGYLAKQFGVSRGAMGHRINNLGLE